jgi:hypothetical protein
MHTPLFYMKCSSTRKHLLANYQWNNSSPDRGLTELAELQALVRFRWIKNKFQRAYSSRKIERPSFQGFTVRSKGSHLMTWSLQAPLTPSGWIVCPTTMRLAPKRANVVCNISQLQRFSSMSEYFRLQTTASLPLKNHGTAIGSPSIQSYKHHKL